MLTSYVVVQGARMRNILRRDIFYLVNSFPYVQKYFCKYPTYFSILRAYATFFKLRKMQCNIFRQQFGDTCGAQQTINSKVSSNNNLKFCHEVLPRVITVKNIVQRRNGQYFPFF